MSAARRHVYPSIAVLLTPLAFVVVLLTFITLGRSLEPRLFPVISAAQITQIEAVEGGSLIWVSFEKFRDCSYKGIAWYHGTRHQNFVRVHVDLSPQGTPPNNTTRPTGQQDAGPWFVALPPGELLNNSFSLIDYKCHPFYETVNVFYP